MAYISKDKIPYYKDGSQGGEEQGDYDASQYYYPREGGMSMDPMHQQQSHGGDRSFHGQAGFVNSSPYGVGSIPGPNMPQLGRPGHLPVSRNVMMGGPAVGVGPENPQMYMGGLNRPPPNAPFNGLQGNGSSSGMYSREMMMMLQGGGGARPGPAAGYDGGAGAFEHPNFPSSSSAGRPPSQQLSQREEDFTIMNENFPALPGSKLDGSHLDGSSQQMQGGNAAHLASSFEGDKFNFGSGSTGESSSQPAAGPSGASSRDGKYGLAGLLDVIRMTDRELNTLALGTDLTTFGLNLNSVDCLFSTFSSPFADQPSAAEPQFNTPACYMVRPPNLKIEHMSKFVLETLFYIFYGMPKDILQACAAQELYRRDWRYHGELKIWLKARTPQEIMQSHPNIHFFHFDVNTWEARLFSSPYRGNILAGLLTEEDVRVRIPPPGQPLAGSV